MLGDWRPPTRRQGRDAHTLWEVLLVLTLLGAVAGLVAPAARLVRSETNGVTSTVRDLVSLLERARLTALERGTTVELRLDPSSGRAWIFAFDADTLRLLETMTVRRVSAVDVLAAGARARFSFTPAGEVFGEPLVIRGLGGAQRIAVDPWTGGVRVVSR
jgi:Tfp pilus assembly protein FimT